MDLVKEILSEVRQTNPFSLEPEDFHAGRLPGHWDIKKVSYHLVLLLEGGFLARSALHAGIFRVVDDGDSGIRLTWNVTSQRSICEQTDPSEDICLSDKITNRWPSTPVDTGSRHYSSCP